MTKRERNRWNLEKIFNIFFRGRWNCFWKGEMKFFCYFLLLHICYVLFIYLYCHTCGDVLFWVFQERQVHSNQDLLSFIATSRLGVLDLDLWYNWAYYCNRVVLVFEHFILYASFVTDCQRKRLLGSKSLKQLANYEHKLV